MGNMIAALMLLAQEDRFSEISRHFRREAETSPTAHWWVWLLALTVLVAGAWLIAVLVDRWRRRPLNDADALLADLCRAHQLDWEQTRLLRRLAEMRQLEAPADLFLDPKTFEPATLGVVLSGRGEELLRLRDQIFGRRLETEGPAAE